MGRSRGGKSQRERRFIKKAKCFSKNAFCNCKNGKKCVFCVCHTCVVCVVCVACVACCVACFCCPKSAENRRLLLIFTWNVHFQRSEIGGLSPFNSSVHHGIGRFGIRISYEKCHFQSLKWVGSVSKRALWLKDEVLKSIVCCLFSHETFSFTGSLWGVWVHSIRACTTGSDPGAPSNHAKHAIFKV